MPLLRVGDYILHYVKDDICVLKLSDWNFFPKLKLEEIESCSFTCIIPPNRLIKAFKTNLSSKLIEPLPGTKLSCLCSISDYDVLIVWESSRSWIFEFYSLLNDQRVSLSQSIPKLAVEENHPCTIKNTGCSVFHVPLLEPRQEHSNLFVLCSREGCVLCIQYARTDNGHPTIIETTKPITWIDYLTHGIWLYVFNNETRCSVLCLTNGKGYISFILFKGYPKTYNIHLVKPVNFLSGYKNCLFLSHGDSVSIITLEMRSDLEWVISEFPICNVVSMLAHDPRIDSKESGMFLMNDFGIVYSCKDAIGFQAVNKPVDNPKKLPVKFATNRLNCIRKKIVCLSKEFSLFSRILKYLFLIVSLRTKPLEQCLEILGINFRSSVKLQPSQYDSRLTFTLSCSFQDFSMDSWFIKFSCHSKQHLYTHTKPFYCSPGNDFSFQMNIASSDLYSFPIIKCHLIFSPKQIKGYLGTHSVLIYSDQVNELWLLSKFPINFIFNNMCLSIQSLVRQITSFHRPTVISNKSDDQSFEFSKYFTSFIHFGDGSTGEELIPALFCECPEMFSDCVKSYSKVRCFVLKDFIEFKFCPTTLRLCSSSCTLLSNVRKILIERLVLFERRKLQKGTNEAGHNISPSYLSITKRFKHELEVMQVADEDITIDQAISLHQEIREKLSPLFALV